MFVWILSMTFPRVLLLVHFSFSWPLLLLSPSIIHFVRWRYNYFLIYSWTTQHWTYKVSQWFKSNKLSINHAKTDFIFFTKSPRPEDTSLPPLIIDSISINRVFSAKFLGVIIDHKWSWSEHISSVHKLICRNSSVISKIRHFLPASSLVLLYNTLILPYLNCCLGFCEHQDALSVHFSKKGYSHLYFLFTKRAFTASFRTNAHSHYSWYQKLHTGILMLKFINNLLPQVISSFFTSVQDTHNHSTRSYTNLYVPFTRTSYSMNTIRFFVPRVWKAIDERIKSQRSSLKRALISQYVSYLPLPGHSLQVSLIFILIILFFCIFIVFVFA